MDKNNMLISISNNIMLTQNEMDVLDKYGIDYKFCKDMNDLLYVIEYYINSSYQELNDLDDVSYSISERSYYMSDRK